MSNNSKDAIVAKAVTLAAAALLACAPIICAPAAYAEPSTDDQAQQDEQKQDDQGNPAEEIPGRVQDGLDQAQRGLDQANKQYNPNERSHNEQVQDLLDGRAGALVLVDGVQVCAHAGQTFLGAHSVVPLGYPC